MSDLIERLRKAARGALRDTPVTDPLVHSLGCLLDEAAAELSRLRERQAWRPIDAYNGEAGRLVPVLVVDQGIVSEAWMDEDGQWYEANVHPSDYVCRTLSPTHWMPLPEPPSDAGTEKETT